MKEDDRQHPEHPRHRELMLPCCTEGHLIVPITGVCAWCEAEKPSAERLQSTPEHPISHTVCGRHAEVVRAEMRAIKAAIAAGTRAESYGA